MSFLIFVLVQFAHAESFESYALNDSTQLSVCFKSIDQLERNLIETEKQIDTFAKSNRDIEKYLHDSTIIGQYLTLFNPTIFSKEKSKAARSCWQYYYDFKTNLKDKKADKKKMLKDWNVCLLDAYKYIPPMAELVTSCYMKLASEFTIRLDP